MYTFFRIILTGIALLLCGFTVMPFVRTSAWWVRGFDFPRVQITVMMAVVLVALGLVQILEWRRRRTAEPEDQVEAQMGSDAGEGAGSEVRPAERDRKACCRRASVALPALVTVLLAAALAWQCFRIFPYTPLAAYQVENVSDAEPGDTVRVLIYNVRYDNRQTEALLACIDETDPDLILLVEPTHWWEAQLTPRLDHYPHQVLQPQENHYGILLYSRLELIDPQVRILVDDEVPSVLTDFRMRSGEIVTFYGLHPKPPGLKRDVDPEREDSDQRDAELLIVAKEVAELVKDGGDQPVIVAGDFNDVAWSHTTRLFQRISGLLDPRVGRGLFNTYHAQSRFHRFPLDHVFTSDHFRLITLQVLPPIGSDHHAVLIALALQPTAPATQEEPAENAGDRHEAEETIKKAKESEQSAPQD